MRVQIICIRFGDDVGLLKSGPREAHKDLVPWHDSAVVCIQRVVPCLRMHMLIAQS